MLSVHELPDFSVRPSRRINDYVLPTLLGWVRCLSWRVSEGKSAEDADLKRSPRTATREHNRSGRPGGGLPHPWG
jgi:hypothetical protein